MPSWSLTPPSEDHEVVEALYPSYDWLSVLKRIAPSSVTPGLWASVPTGITREVDELTFTDWPNDGVNVILEPPADETTLLVMKSLSLIFTEFNVLRTPVTSRFPLALSKLPFPEKSISPEILIWVAVIPKVPELLVISFKLIVPPTIFEADKLDETLAVEVLKVELVSPAADNIPVKILLLIISTSLVSKTSTLSPEPNVLGLFKSIVINPSSPFFPPTSGASGEK